MSNFYITFGQKYRSMTHPSFPKAHPDGFLVIVAPTYEEAREYAFRRLGDRWSMIYELRPNSLFFPLQELGRWTYEKP